MRPFQQVTVPQFVAAFRSQFGESSVIQLPSGAATPITVTSPDNRLTLQFKHIDHDTVPFRAIGVVRESPVDDVAMYHLARVNLQVQDALCMALLNGVHSGEDTALAEAIHDAESRLHSVG